MTMTRVTRDAGEAGGGRVVADGADLQAEHGARRSGSARRRPRASPRRRPAWRRMRSTSGGRTPASRIGALCGQPPPIGSFSGPSSIIWTKSRTTKLRRSVVTTSSTPSRSLSSVGPSIRSAPASAAGEEDQRARGRRPARRSRRCRPRRRRARRHRAGPRRRCCRAARGRRRGGEAGEDQRRRAGQRLGEGEDRAGGALPP